VLLAAYVVTLPVFMGLTVLAVWALMWVARRWLHIWVALAIGGAAVVYFVQNIIRGIIFCSQPGTFIEPEPGSGGDGTVVFNCDAAGGAIDRYYLYFVGPIGTAALVWLVWRCWTSASAVETLKS